MSRKPQPVFARGRWYHCRFKDKKYALGIPTGPMKNARWEEAQEAYANKLKQLIAEENNPGQAEMDKHTLSELLDQYMKDKGHKRADAHLNYRMKDGKLLGRVNRFYENGFTPDMKLKEVTPVKLTKYKNARLAAGKTPACLNRELAFLRQAWFHGIKILEWCRYPNPVTVVGLEKGEFESSRYLREDEETRLRAVCPQELWDRYEALMLTGLRRAELLRLRWPNIDFKNKRVTIHLTKNKQRRTIPLDAGAAAVFARLTRSLKTDLVFYDENHEMLEGDVITKPMGKYLKLAHIEKRTEEGKMTPHALRHTYATRKLLDEEKDLYQIGKLLGHKDLKMTARYSHHDIDSLREPENKSTKSAQTGLTNGS